MIRPLAAPLLGLAVAGVLMACGGDAQPEVEVIPADDERVPTLQPGERDCGSVPAPDDYPTNIRATGVDCQTARLIVREVMEGRSETPLNFACPDALDNDDLSKHCTKGSLKVTWDIRVQ